MTAPARLLLLAALCGGALLVGVELFITAVALPRIVADLADWTQLRRASWVVNGYLVAYVAAMPLAGRAADRFGLPRLLMLALAVFGVGSLLAGAAQTLDQLILARVVQGVGGGAVLPLATAGASHLFSGHGRARALGLVAGSTFLGMALGPFLGALALEWLELGQALRGVGVARGPIVDLATPAWRWVFYGGAPLALLALVYVWAAAPDWRVPRSDAGIDAPGAALFSVALASGLVALTLVGEPGADAGGIPLPVAAATVAIVAAGLALRRMARTPHPFLDPRLFRHRPFASAVLVSLLTGYGLATAIVGSAVFVDRVRYAGPDEQRVALGGLALAMSVGALVAGLLMRHVRPVPLTAGGLLVAIAGLVGLATADRGTPLLDLAAWLVVFGLGFGVTVTPRSAVAVEAAGRRAFGMASAAVTVARMAGMAVGLAVLTALGTTRIDALARVIRDPAARDVVLPERLRGRPLEDPLVVAVLEAWAADEAAAVLGSLFALAALVTLAALVPAIAMRERPSRPPSGIG
jgi:MFS family permease